MMKKRFLEKMTVLMAVLCAVTMISFASPAALAESGTASPIFSYDDLFTKRDLKQEADLTDAIAYTVTDGEDIHIEAAGTYVLSGTAQNVTVYVEAGSEDKVQLVLNGLNLTNSNFPCIYVISADKVFVTTTEDSSLTVTGTFKAYNGNEVDGVIFSHSDLVLNGTAVLTVSSSSNGIVGKDDVKITGGTYAVTASANAIRANDSIRIADGTLTLIAGTDGLHAENSSDDSLGYVYIGGGSLTIQATDDGIHANSVVQIDDGTISVTAAEGIEGTYIQINGGSLTIQAKDDGLNAANKSSAYSTAIEINGGEISVTMASGDTDAIDSNGDIIVNGGTINVNGSSTFDYDGTAQYNGGTIIVNGQQINYIPNQMMGGGQMGVQQNGGFGGRGR